MEIDSVEDLFSPEIRTIIVFLAITHATTKAYLLHSEETTTWINYSNQT